MQNPNIGELLSGLIYMYLHIGPDQMPKHVDAIEAAEQTADIGSHCTEKS